MVTSPTTIAEQTEDELGGSLSILTLQRRDHVRLDHLMARARNTEPDGGVAHEAALRKVARLVFTHAFAEEAVLFPAARRVLPEGDPLTLRIEEDHQSVDELVARLDDSSPDDPEHRALMHRTFEVLHADVRHEEDELLPRLQQHMTVLQLRLLGIQWQLLRLASPTRAHPVVSRRPPGQVLSALPLTVIDRSRDKVQQLDGLTGWRLTPPLRGFDRLLAGAAGALERTELLRRGERSKTSRPARADIERRRRGRTEPSRASFTRSAASPSRPRQR